MVFNEILYFKKSFFYLVVVFLFANWADIGL
jgi:hypothetical protein